MIREEQIFNKITFLLPIKERQHISERIVKHINKSEYKLNILIADGSRKSQEKIFKPLTDKHHVIYKKYPYDENIAQFAKKFYLSSKLVKTKYCSLIESDELINFENYINLVNFLEENDKYIFVTGKIINFNITKDNSVEIFEKQCHPNFGDLKKDKFTLDHHPSCWEGVHRIENLNKTLKNIFDIIDKDLNMLSLVKLFNIFTLTQGNAKFFQNKTISFRQANTHHFDKDKSISANQNLIKRNKIQTLLFIRSFKYYIKMYFILNQHSKIRNLKKEFIRYYIIYFYSCIKNDFFKFFKIIFFSLNRNKTKFFNDKKFIVLNNIKVCGSESLDENERKKLGNYIENFSIKI